MNDELFALSLECGKCADSTFSLVLVPDKRRMAVICQSCREIACYSDENIEETRRIIKQEIEELTWKNN